MECQITLADEVVQCSCVINGLLTIQDVARMLDWDGPKRSTKGLNPYSFLIKDLSVEHSLYPKGIFAITRIDRHLDELSLPRDEYRPSKASHNSAAVALCKRSDCEEQRNDVYRCLSVIEPKSSA